MGTQLSVPNFFLYGSPCFKALHAAIYKARTTAERFFHLWVAFLNTLPRIGL